MSDLSLAVIIPTKDREQELRRLLKSLDQQDVAVKQVILVDSGDGEIEFFQKEFSQLNISYQFVSPPSLTAQRNAGLKMVRDDIDLVCFLDDDIVFEPGAMAAMMQFWQNAADNVGGAVFNIINEKQPTAFVNLKRIFLTGVRERGVVLRSGYNTLICPAQETRQVQWLFGGATVWRKELFDRYRFDEWIKAGGLCEDLDFSYRVAKEFRLFVVSEAKVLHLSFAVGMRKDNFYFGISQIYNRIYFVKKHVELSLGLCLWACFGQFVENVIRAILSLTKAYFIRALGNLKGMITCWKIVQRSDSNEE